MFDVQSQDAVYMQAMDSAGSLLDFGTGPVSVTFGVSICLCVCEGTSDCVTKRGMCFLPGLWPSVEQ